MAKGWSFDSLVKALKGGAFLNVGKTKETVAAGDDSRIVNALQKGNNLSDVANAEAARTNLGVYANRGRLGKTNLNTLFADNAAGVWNQGLDENIEEGNNYPVAYAGSLLILPNLTWEKGASQVYYPYHNRDVFFIRTTNGGTSSWSPWSTYESGNVLRTLITAAQTTANNANTNANGRVPNTRKVNGKPLSADINLTAGDVGAYSKTESDSIYQPKGVYDNIPVGSPIPWSLTTPPSGYLICNGQTFNKSTYPKLAIAYPSGKLPDLRGEFIRGLDSGRGVDSGRQMLSAQVGNSLLSSNIFGRLSSSESNKWHKTIDYIGISGTDNDGGYGVYQQIEGANGNETRPRNIAFLYIVRAA